MHVIPKISNTRPSQTEDVNTMDLIKDLHLAEKSFAHLDQLVC